jgi:hypothetical protein
MEPLALMELEASIANVHLERLDYCVIWTTLVPQIPAMLMQFVTLAL